MMFGELGYQLFRAFVSMLPWGTTRTKYIVKHRIFKEVGENFYFCPRKIPADPKLIIFHNNVSVAADVMFCNHDVIQKVFNCLPEDWGGNEYQKYYGCIEVMDNVFIGTKAVILPNVRIGSNVIVAAGSIVTGDLESGGIYAGNPARRVGDFNKLLDKRAEYTKAVKNMSSERLNMFLWESFKNKRSS